LLTAIAYVDLNPIRAGIAATPEDSEFTSIYQRIRQTQRLPGEGVDVSDRVPLRAFPLTGRLNSEHNSIPLELLDWTGRAVREDKRGVIDRQLPPIIERLNIDADVWGLAMRPRGNVFGRALGRLDHLRLHAKALGQAWVRGLQRAERLYG
jgi:hypothetical protein